MSTRLLELAREIGNSLKQKQWFLATAESCTGGQVAYTLTSVPGSSQWFDRGFVTYTDEAKQEMLGVDEQLLHDYGAVSEQTAAAMAAGAVAASHAQVGIAVTGIAGPSGGSVSKPVGTIWLAWQIQSEPTTTQCFQFKGDRLTIRDEATAVALYELVNLLKNY